MRYFKEGEIITTDTGGRFKILRFNADSLFIGEGGQGVVYLVEDGSGGRHALKWYKKGAVRYEKEFHKNLDENINDGAPSAKFVWPKYLTEYKNGSFGYIMDLFPPGYVSFKKLLLEPQEAKIGLEAMCNAALNIINAFRDLHRVGKSYQDINDGGFVIRLDDANATLKGDVLICDCDNVSPAGINLGIAGKAGYMAPEIVTGRGKIKPSMRTDAYSLANILFRLLMRGDPLAGARDSAAVCLTEEAERDLYGENPIFVCDPNNDRNRPVRGVHDNIINKWPTYPSYIRKAFVDAFSEGLKNPDKRIAENEWQKLFVRLKGELIQCFGCNVRAFADVFRKGHGFLTCPACGQTYPMPKLIAPNGFPIVLFPGVKLLQGHTNSQTNSLDSADYLIQTGLVVQNPKDPNRWGIRNMSGASWSVKGSGLEGRQEIENGKTIAIENGLEITFPNGKTTIITESE